MALRGVIFEVEKGEVIAILGASGCGKTALLNLVAGLFRPNEISTGGYSRSGRAEIGQPQQGFGRG